MRLEKIITQLTLFSAFRKSDKASALSEKSKEIFDRAIQAISNQDENNTLTQSDFDLIKKEIQVLSGNHEGSSLINNPLYPDSPTANAKMNDLKKLAENKPTEALDQIEYDNALSDKDCVEILKICARYDPRQVIAHMKCSDKKVKNESDRLEIAIECAKTDLEYLIDSLNRFKIKNEDNRIKLALICMQESPSETSFPMKNFNISNQQALFEIAKVGCSKDTWRYIAWNIKRIGIIDQKFLGELGLLCMQYGGNEAIDDVKKFGITDQQTILEIIQLILLQDEKKCLIRNMAKNIDEYYLEGWNITDQQPIRLAVFKCCAKMDVASTGEHINFFGITDEAVLFSFAKEYIATCGAKVIPSIANFGITDQKALHELVVLCAQQDVRKTIKLLPSLKITDQNTLIQYAEFCAEKNAWATAQLFLNFNIESNQARINIAKLCCKQNPERVAIHIENFNIEDEKDRIEIAKLCAQGAGETTALYISDFEISDASERFNIAQICAQSEPYQVARRIKRFHLGEDKIIELLKLCIILDYHSNDSIFWYDLSNQDDILKIYELVIFGNKNYPIDDGFFERKPANLLTDENKQKLLLYRFKLNPTTASLIKSDSVVRQKFIELSNDEISLPPAELLETIKQFIGIVRPLSEKNAQPILNAIQQYEDPNSTLSDFKKNELFHSIVTKGKLFAAMYFYLEYSISDPSDRQKVIDSDVVLQVLNYWQPHLRWDLFQTMWPLILTDKTIPQSPLATFDQLIASLPKTAVDCHGYVIELAKDLALQGVSIDVIKNFLGLAFQHKQNFKDGRVAGLLIETLLAIIQHPGLSVKEKEQLLNKITRESQDLRELDFRSKYPDVALREEKLKILDPKSKAAANQRKLIQQSRDSYDKKYSTELQLLKVIKFVLPMIKMNKFALILKDGSLIVNIQNSLLELVPIGEIDHFEDKFSRFVQSRRPEAIYQYAANIQRTNSPQAMTCLANYIISVLNSTVENDQFRAARYATDGSPHLQQIAKSNPEMYQTWQKGDIASFDELGVGAGSEPEKMFDYDNWLRTKIGDQHIPIDELNLQFLNNYMSGADRNSLISELKNELEEIQDHHSEDFAKLQFQLLCLELTLESDPSVQKNKLEEIKTLLSSAPFNRPEFLNDVNGLLNPVRKNSGTNLFVVDSDDPIDLLLAGTEVAGSCQNVAGSHELNRGLLGYLMNGWNRILKVSTSADGPIQARCMLRLLWDGEQPVLFQERFYPDNIDAKSKAALTAMAKKRAIALGVPLISLNGEKYYEKTVMALGGIAPFEYSDASGGVHGGVNDDSKYTINNAKYVE